MSLTTRAFSLWLLATLAAARRLELGAAKAKGNGDAGRGQKRGAEDQDPCEHFSPRQWRACQFTEGCVYLPNSEEHHVKAVSAFRPYIGSCVSAETLFRELPPRVNLLPEPPSGDAVRFLTNGSEAFLPLAPLCSEDDSWKAPECQRLCPRDLSHSPCTSRHGCVYVYAAHGRRNNLEGVPPASRAHLKLSLGNCASKDGLVGASPMGSEWKAADEVVDFVLQAKGYGGEALMLQFPMPVVPTDPVGRPDCEEDRRVPPASQWPSMAARVEHILQDCFCSYWKDVETLGPVKHIKTDYRFAQADPEEFLQVEYGCWRNVMSKKLRMPVQFEYVATVDTGNEKREDVFLYDETPGLLEWQPPRWARSDKYGVPFDVGHLVMANHFDGSRELITATNLLTNVVPQLSDMNKFAWLATEMLTECAREVDAENVFVIGGCVWPEDPDHIEGFDKMGEYKLLVPDYCWKILSAERRGHVAFYIPNTPEARISKKKGEIEGVQQGIGELAPFVVSVNELEELLSSRQTPQIFDMSDEEKRYKPTGLEIQRQGWSLDCDMAL